MGFGYGYGYRVWDPYYGSYVYWGPDQEVYYNRWLGENHMPYRNFRRLGPEDRSRYFSWRHGQHIEPDLHRR